MRHFALSFCICCSILLSVGNRFLVSIQQHKMSLSGGRESDEYIHLHSAVLCSAQSVCLCVHTKACVCASVMHVYESICSLESITYHFVFLRMCAWIFVLVFMHGCTSGYVHAHIGSCHFPCKCLDFYYSDCVHFHTLVCVCVCLWEQ